MRLKTTESLLPEEELFNKERSSTLAKREKGSTAESTRLRWRFAGAPAAPAAATHRTTYSSSDQLSFSYICIRLPICRGISSTSSCDGLATHRATSSSPDRLTTCRATNSTSASGALTPYRTTNSTSASDALTTYRTTNSTSASDALMTCWATNCRSDCDLPIGETTIDIIVIRIEEFFVPIFEVFWILDFFILAINEQQIFLKISTAHREILLQHTQNQIALIFFTNRIYDSIVSDLEQQQQRLPTAPERQQQPNQQQQPGGAALENWDAADSLTYVPRPRPPVRSKTEKRHARRERRRIHERGQPQRARSPEPGRPIPGQNRIPGDMGWLEKYIRNQGLPADICRAVDSTRPRTLELALAEAIRLEKRMAAHIIPDTRTQRNPREIAFRQREPVMERAYYPSEDTRPHPRANYAPFIGYITEARPYEYSDGGLEYEPPRDEYEHPEDFPREYYPQEGEGNEDPNRPWIGYMAPKPQGSPQGVPPNYYVAQPSRYTYSRQEYERQRNYNPREPPRDGGDCRSDSEDDTPTVIQLKLPECTGGITRIMLDNGATVNLIKIGKVAPDTKVFEGKIIELEEISPEPQPTYGYIFINLWGTPYRFYLIADDFPLREDALIGRNLMRKEAADISYHYNSMAVCSDPLNPIPFVDMPESQGKRVNVVTRNAVGMPSLEYIAPPGANDYEDYIADRRFAADCDELCQSGNVKPSDTQTVKIPARTRKLVQLKLVATTLRDGYLPRIDTGHPDVFLGENLVRNDGNTCRVYAINSADRDVEFEIRPAEIHPFDYVVQDFESDGSTESEVQPITDLEQRANRIREIVDLRTLNLEEKETILDLIHDYPDLFLVPGDPLPCTNLVYHEIPLENNIPINTKQYRHPPIHKEVVKKDIEKRLQEGIIEPSASPMNFPIWIVPKKPGPDGTPKWRVVIDFRELNKKTVSDAYPLPNIADIMDQLGRRAAYFSTFDLASGFHQIPMKEGDKWKTAFSTPNGHFQYCPMPMGLKNAAATFQRLMDKVLRGLQNVEMLVYLDDIIVYAKDLREHDSKVRRLFDRLRGRKANPRTGEVPLPPKGRNPIVETRKPRLISGSPATSLMYSRKKGGSTKRKPAHKIRLPCAKYESRNDPTAEKSHPHLRRGPSLPETTPAPDPEASCIALRTRSRLPSTKTPALPTPPVAARVDTGLRRSKGKTPTTSKAQQSAPPSEPSTSMAAQYSTTDLENSESENPPLVDPRYSGLREETEPPTEGSTETDEKPEPFVAGIQTEGQKLDPPNLLPTQPARHHPSLSPHGLRSWLPRRRQ
ncbi:unnamed protein product [Trichogramma brassicae]|uniref:Reverse transcriptase domain-containing protein n=1 Tax=Trichogramma brassicae TaxID=86971 RepID=A0A6H5I8V9_9HYME|nr:unnamed protein product [Trichogramma brassicae]